MKQAENRVWIILTSWYSMGDRSCIRSEVFRKQKNIIQAHMGAEGGRETMKCNCYGLTFVSLLLLPQNSYVEILTLTTSDCECICKQGL